MESPHEQKEAKPDVEALEPELTLRSGTALAGSALSFFVTVGFLNAYGIFQEYYTSDVLRGESAFRISWLGSFAIFCIFSFAPPAGLLSDRYGPQLPMIIGSICMLVAIFMISLCKEYYQFFLAQGLLLGAGMSFLVIPTAGICPRYFKRHRGLATGVSVSGSSLGGVLWPVALDQLLRVDGISFNWSIRIVGFIMIPLLGIAILTVRPPITAPEVQHKIEGKRVTNEKKPVDRSAMKRPPFVLLCLGLFFGNLGFYTVFFYTSTYAVNLGMSQKLAFYLLSIINGASMFGRILPGIVADRWGKFNILTASALFGGIIAFCWTSATSVAGVVVWAAAYGFASGAILSLQLACATSIVNDNASGAAVGVAMGSTSLAGLFCGPISGKLVRYGWYAPSVWSGVMLLVGAVFMLCSRLSLNRKLAAVV